jgi:hypothetical protein
MPQQVQNSCGIRGIVTFHSAPAERDYPCNSIAGLAPTTRSPRVRYTPAVFCGMVAIRHDPALSLAAWLVFNIRLSPRLGGNWRGNHSAHICGILWHACFTGAIRLLL